MPNSLSLMMASIRSGAHLLMRRYGLARDDHDRVRS
jgi:hypothetical protein